MITSFLLSVREGLEAALIIGIVLAALRKMDQSGLSPAVWRGVLAAVGASVVAGLTLTWLGAKFEGQGEAIFEGVAMLIAAVLLTWMIVWMRRKSRTMQSDLEYDVKAAGGNQSALFWLAFLAVAREGLELVLFLIAAQLTSDALQTIIGTAMGLAVAIAMGWVIFASSKRLSLRNFFNFTNVLLILFAAGLVAHGVHEFNEVGWIPGVIEHVYDLNPVLPEKQTFGLLLTAVFGYNANPSLTEIIAYVGYFVGLAIFWKKMGQGTSRLPG